MKIEESIWFDICYEEFDEIRENLKNNKINPNYEQDGLPLLNLIAKTMEVDIAEELLKQGADINIRDKYGNTPVISALLNYSMEEYEEDRMVALLFKHGAKKDAKNYSDVSVSDLVEEAKEYSGKHLEWME